MSAADRRQVRGPLRPLAVFSGLSIVRRGLHLLLLPIYVRYIEPEQYGVLAAVTIAASVIAVISNLKLDAAMRTFYFDHSEDGKALRAYVSQIFSASIYAAGVVYVVMLISGNTIFELGFARGEVRFVPAGAIALATACVSTCMSSYFVYLRNGLELRQLIFWESLLLGGTIGLQLLFLVVLDLGLYGILWGALVPVAVTMLLLCVLRPWLIVARLSRQLLAPSLRYSAPLMLLGIIYALGSGLDRLVLERYVDLASLGAYAILIGLLGLLHIVLNALDNTIRPYLYPLLKASGGQAAAAIASLQRLYVLAGLLALSVTVLLGSNLHFITDDPRYLSLQNWLLWGATAFVTLIVTRFYTLIYDYQKRSIDMTAGILARFAIMSLALMLLVPTFEIEGALWAVLIAESFNALMFSFMAGHVAAIKASIRMVTAQLAIFVAVLWLLGFAVGTKSITLFGAIQLPAIAALLLLINRRVLATPITGAIAELRNTAEYQAN